MALSLENFEIPTKEGIMMPKTKNRFLAYIEDDELHDEDSVFLAQQIQSCDRPSVVLFHEVDNGRHKVKSNWMPLTVIFRDDVTDKTRRLLHNLLRRQMNDSMHCFSMRLIATDGGTDIIEEWKIMGCRIESCQWDSYVYSSAEPLTITLIINYMDARI